MRRAVALIMVSMFTFPIQAQQQAPAQQATTVQFQCRDLAAGGNYLGPDETIMNGMACKRVVVAAQPQASPAVAQAPAAPAPNTQEPSTADPSSAPAASPAASQEQSQASPAEDSADQNATVITSDLRIPPGAVIAIAPMGGFDTYLAAALRRKKAPVGLTIDPAQSNYILVSSEYEWAGWFAASQASSHGSAFGSASWNANGGSANFDASHHANSWSNAGSTRGLEASLMLIDKRSKRVLWAYEVHKSSHGSLLFGTLGARGQQSISEACAKHLKEYIEKGKG